jgi:predicted thioesterase
LELQIPGGTAGEREELVTEAKTAAALGSGSVPVYGTPAMVALMEAAAVEALAGRLPPGHTSVGTDITVTHLRPTPLGATVLARATVTGVEGRLVTFRVEAYQGTLRIGEGLHRRAVVETAKFLARAVAPQ